MKKLILFALICASITLQAQTYKTVTMALDTTTNVAILRAGLQSYNLNTRFGLKANLNGGNTFNGNNFFNDNVIVGGLIPSAKFEVMVPLNTPAYSLSGIPFLKYSELNTIDYGGVGALNDWSTLKFRAKNIEKLRLDSTSNSTFSTTVTALTPTLANHLTTKSYVDSLSALSGNISGTGTTNYIPKFTGTSTIGNSTIFDNGTNVAIGGTSAGAKLDILVGQDVNGYGLAGFPFLKYSTGDVLDYGAFGGTWNGLRFFTNGSPRLIIASSGSAEFTGTVTTPSVTATGLTSGRIPYVSTGGLIKDEAGFTYDEINDRLSVGTLNSNTLTATGNIGIVTASNINLDAAAVTIASPTLSASGYEILTRNLSNNKIEKIGASGQTTTEVTNTTQTLAANGRYIPNNASLVTLTLPTTAAVGDVIFVNGKGAGLWRVAQNASQIIHGSTDTTTGVTGFIEATSRYNCVTLVCIVANTEWVIQSSQGSLTIN